MSTTINGVTFNMETLRPVATHRNVPNEELGSDESFINDMGYSGLVVHLTGFETTLAKYDEVIAEFMKTGAQTLVYRSGWQLSVHSTRLVPLLDIGIVDNWFPYELVMITSTPYRDSTSETTRTKTITTNNQEWSADDSANDIDTDGNVDAVPDIQVTGAAAETLLVHIYNQHTYGESANITDFGQTFTTTADMNNVTKICVRFGSPCTPGTFTLEIWDSFAKNASYGSESGIAYSGGAESTITFDPIISLAPSTQYYMHIHIDSGVAQARYSVGDAYAGGQYYNWAAQPWDLFCTIYYGKDAKDIEIYNTTDSTVKCAVCNDILDTAIHRINADGTGTINFDDDFSTNKYVYNSTVSGVTYDATDDELDIADDGYIYWKCDAKGVITGIPTLTSRVNITAGTPTIQISIDAATWYDITTAIVDDVDTEYELDSASLSLKGETLFYWRYDCVKAAAATCSIKSFELDVEMHTIDFEHPKISESGVSTVRCDQDADSGMACEVSLIYRDRSWVG